MNQENNKLLPKVENKSTLKMDEHVSKEQLAYLQSIKREKRFIRVSQILFLIMFFSLWQYAASKGMIDTFLTSSPKAIWDLMVKFILDGSLFNHFCDRSH
jgi:NitT/TauT family transport system permease protein